MEVVKSLDEIAANSMYKFILLVPKNDTCHQLNLKNIDILKAGNGHGHVWEQLILPLYAKGSLLINLCGPAPILKMNQIVMIHDAAIYTNKDNFSKIFLLWYKMMFKFIKSFSKKILTVSEFSKRELIKYCGIKETKISVAYLGVEQIVDRSSDDSILDTFNLRGKKFLLAVSSKSPNKNFKAIAESIKHLQHDKEVEVVIVGTQNSHVFQSNTVLDIDRVKFTGYISDEELKSLYENASCFIYPSFYEGFGLPPIEAMVCRCPVIVSHTSSLPEVCGDNAIYCDPYDPLDISEKIDSVLKRSDLDQMIEKNYKHARKYSWKKTAQDLMVHIDLILAKGMKPREKNSLHM
ncbi:MAG: glycosyltransferase family 4 protein [Bacillota bacterium]